jgi:hypothetical protein
VNDIFAAADAQMSDYNKSCYKSKKKRKQRRKFRILLLVLVILAAIVSGVIFGGIKIQNEIRQSYEEIKFSFLYQYALLQEEYKKMDDNLLTPTQCYEKQLVLLLDPKEMEQAINSIEDMDTISNLFSAQPDPGCDTSLLPADKVDEYNRLIEEYRKAYLAESEQ